MCFMFVFMSWINCGLVSLQLDMGLIFSFACIHSDFSVPFLKDAFFLPSVFFLGIFVKY